jgi:RNA polymerase sigma factor (sigma-70 family)
MEGKAENEATSGNAISADEIFSTSFRDKLLRFARNVRPDQAHADHEDAVHDVLVNIHEHVSQNPAAALPRKLESYGYRSVANRLNDFYRKHHREVIFDEGANQDFERQKSTEEVEEQFRRTRLFSLLILALKGDVEYPTDNEHVELFMKLQTKIKNCLSPKQLIVMRMRGLDSMTIKECADRLGVSVGSVHGWYNGALQTCQQIAAEIGLDMGDLL